MAIKKDLLLNTVSNGIQFGSRWIMNIVLAKNIAISNFGIFSFIYSVATLISIFLTFGSNLYHLNYIKTKTQKSLKYLFSSFIISTLFFFILLILLIFFSIFNISINLSFDYYYFYYALLLGFVWSINLNIFSFCKSIDLFKLEAKAYLFFSFLLIFSLMIGIIFRLFEVINLEWILVALIILNLVPFIIGFLNIKKLYNLKMQDIINDIKFSYTTIYISVQRRFFYGLHEFQSILFSNLPFLLLGILMTPYELGIYRAIYVLITPLLILPVIISQVLLRYLTKTKNNKIQYKKIFRKFLLFSLLIGLFIMSFYYFLDKEILEVVYQKKFDMQTSLSLLKIFTLFAFLGFIKSNYEVLLTSLGKQKLRVKVLWIVLVLYPSLIFVLPNSLRIFKYAYASLFTALFMLVIYIIYSEIELIKYK